MYYEKLMKILKNCSEAYYYVMIDAPMTFNRLQSMMIGQKHTKTALLDLLYHNHYYYYHHYHYIYHCHYHCHYHYNYHYYYYY